MDVVSWDVPLSDEDDDIERMTESGLILPAPVEGREGSHPIVCAQTDTPGLVFNFSGPEQRDLEAIAGAIRNGQLQLEAGEVPALLWLRDPVYGKPVAITPAGLRHIVSVTRGYSKLIDVSALRSQQRNAADHLLVPDRQQRRHPLN